MNYLQRTRLLLFITLSLQLPRKRSPGRHILSWQESSLVDQTCVCSGMAKQPGQAQGRGWHCSETLINHSANGTHGERLCWEMSPENGESGRRECPAVGSESALGPKRVSNLVLATYQLCDFRGKLPNLPQAQRPCLQNGNTF